MKTYVEQNPGDACLVAASLIARRLRRAVHDRDRASIAVSGGGTPGPMFDALAASDVPWGRVDVFQVDERIAPDGDDQRNANQLTERFLAPAGVPSRRIHLMPVTASDLRAACARYAKAVAAIEPFDVVHVGIGDDGHTASWVPGDPVIDSERAVDVSGEYQGTRRMTLTPGVVNAARMRLMLVTEGTKRPAVDAWLRGDRSLPVSRVRRTNTLVVATAAALSATWI